MNYCIILPLSFYYSLIQTLEGQFMNYLFFLTCRDDFTCWIEDEQLIVITSKSPTECCEIYGLKNREIH